ncbi:hypothetical protein ACLKA6_008013 [Drosophila palustris]
MQSLRIKSSSSYSLKTNIVSLNSSTGRFYLPGGFQATSLRERQAFSFYSQTTLRGVSLIRRHCEFGVCKGNLRWRLTWCSE